VARVLLAVTGSVAAIKTPELAALIQSHGHELRIVATKSATYFFDPAPFRHSHILTLDSDEWPGDRYQRGDPVRHIELRTWADVMCIAPLDANTLAKIANGLCDNALTSVVRAWDMSKPMIVAPAMNTFMWQHPLTQQQLTSLSTHFKSNRFHMISPITKRLACGDEGIGAMADIGDIVASIRQTVAVS
jgi:phosphopantothenoylcysteine decarboxylase